MFETSLQRLLTWATGANMKTHDSTFAFFADLVFDERRHRAFIEAARFDWSNLSRVLGIALKWLEQLCSGKRRRLFAEVLASLLPDAPRCLASHLQRKRPGMMGAVQENIMAQRDQPLASRKPYQFGTYVTRSNLPAFLIEADTRQTS